MSVNLSTDQILDAVAGFRAEGFLFELTDSARNSLGTLDVDLDQPPTVTVDTTRSIIRTCTSLAMSAVDLSAIDVRRQRIRPSMVLANGARLPMGILTFGNDNRAPFSWGTTWTPDLFDESFIVAQPLAQPAGLAPGDSILTLLLELVATVGLPDVDFSAVVDAASTSALAYPAGSNRKTAIDALARLLGAYPPFFDNMGTYRLRAAPAPGAPVDHVYETGTRVIDGSVLTTNSGYQAPNLYQVVSSGPGGSIVGLYELPPDAPNSKENRDGEVIVNTVTMPGLPNVDLANLAAYINALTDKNTYTQATFNTPADPRHDVFDLVQLYGIRYQETGWAITCSPGAPMTHSLTGLFS